MAEETTQRFELRKVYVKDLSFESPMAPDIFRTAAAAPTIDVQLNIDHDALGDDIYESLLTVTVNGKVEEKDAFLVEVQQAGVYEIAGVEADQDLSALLEITCPNMLFPFAREAINELIVRGGFPQLLLSPVNFETMYRQRIRRANDVRGPANGGENTGEAVAPADADGTSS